ncbi:hypothetical protein HY632_05325 [Candidatus Uhrbacteria bacterium]|nr:hypothetical protein [Candidatus Uhrbacteria bacterium]
MSNVRYHAHCIDGIVSAAIVKRVYRNAIQFDACTPYRAPFPGTTPERMSDTVGVDIPYHDGMQQWYDHHDTGLQYFPPPHQPRSITCAIHFDPNARACVELLPLPDPSFAPLVQEIAILDSGQFADVDAACDLANPVLLAARTIQRLEDDAIDQRIIDVLVDTVEDPIPALLHAIPEDLRNQTRTLVDGHAAFLRATGHLTTGSPKLLALDLTTDAPTAEGLSPFHPFQVFPDCDLCLVLRETTRGVYVRMSRNPWYWSPTFPCRLDVIARAYGGSGHATVASIRFPRTDEGRNWARDTYTQLLETLSRTTPHTAHTVTT